MNAAQPLGGSAPPLRSAIVVGAGLGGLATALALLRSGWRVRIYEQAPVLSEVGAGISVSPGAGRGLASLGLEAELLKASLPIPDIAFVHYRTGALLAGKFDHGSPPDHGFQKARHIHRADLHSILVEGVRREDPGALVTGKRLTGLTQDDAGVTAQFADGSSARADILIGADGSRSTVRQQLFDPAPPEFAGQIAFRCLIDKEAAMPFMQGGNAVVSIGASKVFNRYLIRGGSLVNVIGIAKSDRWKQEGWNTPATVADFLAEFEEFNENVRGLIQLSPPETLIKWGLVTRPPLSEWSSGRVILIGDAAHPILPFLGLGAALAIEDGVVLSRALAMTLEPQRAFTAFQAARRERVETVRTQTILQGEIIQASDPDADEMTSSPSQKADLFSYDPCTVPIEL